MLMKTMKTNERSPELTGHLKLQPRTLAPFNKQFEATNSDEIICNIAAWGNKDDGANYVTIELFRRFVPRSSTRPRSNLVNFIFDEDEEQ
jgi:hypothetical protein